MMYIADDIDIEEKDTIRKDVLIVEDSPSLSTYLAQLLDRKGYNTDVANTARSAVEKFRKNLPGVVILDFKLPDKDGDYVLEKIKKINPISQTIVVTGYDDYNITVNVIQAGAADYYRKPLKKEKILSSVNKAFNIYKSMHITTGRFKVIFYGNKAEGFKKINKRLNKQNFYLKNTAGKDELFDQLKKGVVDVVIVDCCSKKEKLKIIKDIVKLEVSVEIIVMGKARQNQLPVEAIRYGASSFIRYPQDIEDINIFLNRAVNCLKLKRLNDFKLNEIKNSSEIEVKITDARRIEIDVYKPEKTLSSSYAFSLINNIPLGIGLIDRAHNIFYMNRHFERLSPKKSFKKIDENFVQVLKESGMNDITQKVLKTEIERLFVQKEDIETITLGKKEACTLTSLKLITGRGPVETVLMIVR